MFGMYVGWVLFAVNPATAHTLRPNSLLYPKGVRVEVSQLVKALPVAYASGGARIRPYTQRQLDAGVA